MADVDTENGIMEENAADEFTGDDVSESVNEIGQNMNGQVGVDVSEDILQHALVDGTDSFPDEVQIQYTEGVQALQDGDIITTASGGVEFMTTDVSEVDTETQLSETLENDSYILSNEQNVQNSNEVIESIISEGNVATSYASSLAYVSSEQKPVVGNIVQVTNVNVIKPQTVTVQAPNHPLGSSLNPIRIIQQGNQYTPVQQLTTEQLQQIMQVVQQQQVNKTLDTGSSVLFNPQTNTRIVYRVIYPSDLHKDVSGAVIKKDTEALTFATPKRIYKKRIKEEDGEKADGPEMSKEEKDQRKKIRPKTRSGRVSKPPKHMVKDFKHIHVLDYDEEYDDSDGGYSDYKVGDSDDDSRERKVDDTVFGLNSVKPKNWKCVSCGKAYIGRAGLGRHLKLYPTHGFLDPDGDGDMVPPETPPGDMPRSLNGKMKNDSDDVNDAIDYTPPEAASEHVSNDLDSAITPNGLGGATSFSEDSHDSVTSMTGKSHPQPRGHHRRGRPRGHRGSWRGRGAYSKVDPEARRKHRLKDITRESTDEELMEIVLPRLAKVITLWEFLLMKVERGDPAWPHADDIYMEYTKLHQHVKKLCQEYLQYVTDTDADKDPSLFKIECNPVSESLGLKCGHHKVKEIPDNDGDMVYKYKFLTTNHNVDIDYNNKSILKRTVAIVPQEQIISPVKKARVTKSLLPVSTANQTPSVITISQPQPVMTANVLMNSFSQPTGNVVQTSDAVHIIPSEGSVPQTTLSSGKPSGQRAVSLLSNSLINNPSSSLQTTKNSSQKFIIVSGMTPNGGNESQFVGIADSDSGSAIRTFVPIAPNTSTIQTAATGQTVVALTNNPTFTADQLIVSTDNVNIDPATGLNQKQIQSQVVQQSLLPFPVSSSQPVYITLPQHSHGQTHVIQTDMPDQGNINGTQQMLTNNGQFVVKYDAANNISVHNNGDTVTSSTDSFMVVTSSGDGSSSARTLGSIKDGGSSVFTMHTSEHSDISGSVDEEVSVDDHDNDENVYSVDAAMLLVNDATKNGTMSNDDSETMDSALTVSTASDTVGVIASVDTSSTNQVQVAEDEGNDSIEQMGIGEGSGGYDHLQGLTGEECDGEDSKQPDSDNPVSLDMDETLQIPASNIYQTEDGMVIIQNADGATFQLQGSDGQPISLETVQALMSMDGDTQFVTEHTEQGMEQE